MSIDTSRRALFKKAGVASAAMLGSPFAFAAGIPAKTVEKYDETFDVVVIGCWFGLRTQGWPRWQESACYRKDDGFGW